MKRSVIIGSVIFGLATLIWTTDPASAMGRRADDTTQTDTNTTGQTGMETTYPTPVPGTTQGDTGTGDTGTMGTDTDTGMDDTGTSGTGSDSTGNQ